MTLTANILTTFSARVATLGLALISSVVLTRWLGPDGRGLFAQILLLPGLVTSLGLLGLDQANAVYAGLHPERRGALVWHSACVAFVVGAILAVFGISFVAMGAPGFGSLVRGPLWLYVLPMSIIPARLAAEYASAILRGMNHIFLLNLVEVSTRVVGLVLTGVFIVWFGLGVAGAAWMEFTAGLGCAVTMIALLARVGVIGRPVFDKVLWTQTWRFAIPVYSAAIMTFLNYRVDQFIIAALLPPEQLGFYSLAVDLTERLWILTGAVATALLPHLTNSPKHQPVLTAIICRHVLLWTAAAALGMFLLADVLVRFLYSPAFAPVSIVVRCLLPGVLTLTIGKVLIGELAARKKIAFTAWLAGGSALVNIIANFALIPVMGISGAALASSISYSIVGIVVLQRYVRETGVPWTAIVPRYSDFLVYARLWNRGARVRIPADGMGLRAPSSKSAP